MVRTRHNDQQPSTANLQGTILGTRRGTERKRCADNVTEWTERSFKVIGMKLSYMEVAGQVLSCIVTLESYLL